MGSMKRPRFLRWLPAHRLPALVVTLAIVAILGLGLSFVQQIARPKTTLFLGDGVFTAILAQTPDTRTQGLSGTSQLAADQAMLFAFTHDDRWSIWMKDMNYPIDVVWLDADKHVVYIVKNMAPDTYPKQYAPERAARYVVELPAGTVEAKSIGLNSVARFELATKEVK